MKAWVPARAIDAFNKDKFYFLRKKFPGGGKKPTHTYKGRSYMVHVGPQGGKYITVAGKKVYV